MVKSIEQGRKSRRGLSRSVPPAVAGGSPYDPSSHTGGTDAVTVLRPATPGTQLRLGRGRCWRAYGHAAIDNHLNFDTTVLRASGRGRILRDSLCLTVTHWRDETTKRNLMIHCQVLHYCIGALPTKSEILRLAAGRIGVPCNFDHIAFSVEGFFCHGIKLSLGLG